MHERPKLECDVHDLLDAANLLILTRAPNVANARDLIIQLRDCADQAKAAGADYLGAEGRLRGAADALEAKVGTSGAEL